MFIFIFKLKGFTYLLEFNLYFYFLIFIILFLYSILLSKTFIIFLFNFYLEIKKYENIFSNISLKPISHYSPFKFVNNLLSRNYSTLNRNIVTDTDIDQIYEPDSETFQLEKFNSVKEFKQKYAGGYLGYSDIHHFGNITEFSTSSGIVFGIIYENLQNKLENYLKSIPDNITYSVLPVLRWEYPNGESLNITASGSIKITRFISTKYLARLIANYIFDALRKYEIQVADVELLILSRPWLSVDEFNVGIKTVTEALNDQIEKEVLFSKQFTQKFKKASNFKNYLYKDVIFNSYGDPIYDKNNNLIGYKISETDYASVKTYYNENNLLCNKISIKEFDQTNLSFKNDSAITWIDIKTDFGFIRKLNTFNYFYDKNNNIFNVEAEYNYSSFPTYHKDLKLDTKIGTIDLETYGTNLGLGHHQVYAGGWAIKNYTKLLYIKKMKLVSYLLTDYF